MTTCPNHVAFIHTSPNGDQMFYCAAHKCTTCAPATDAQMAAQIEPLAVPAPTLKLPLCGDPTCTICELTAVTQGKDPLPAYTPYYPYTAWKPPKSAKLAKSYKAKNQKARGIQVLADHFPSSVPSFRVFSLPLSEDLDTDAFNHIALKRDVFVRPCPITPRHGFVDSRIVDRETVNDLLSLAKEAQAADPQAELVVMEAIPASASAVLTPTSIAIGPGTSSATQGKGAITLPLTGVHFRSELLREAQIKDTPYAEALYTTSDSGYSNKTYLVQLRDGVGCASAHPAGMDWIPADTIVSAVYSVPNYEKDALAFEQAIKDAPAGSILWHPGGTLLSHYSQHAMLRKMPILFWKEAPVVGQSLAANVNATARPFVGPFHNGLLFGLTIEFRDSERFDAAAQFGLVVLHNATSLILSENGAFYVGMGVAILLRLAYAAIAGEFRHHQRKKYRSRDEVYRQALAGTEGFFHARKVAPRAWRSFNFMTWSSGFGGEAWGRCTAVTPAFDAALLHFLKDPQDTGLNAIIASAHNVINCAHNNGRFLSKYCTQSTFEEAARGDFMTTLRGLFWGYVTANPPNPAFAPTVAFTFEEWQKANNNNRDGLLKAVTKLKAMQEPRDPSEVRAERLAKLGIGPQVKKVAKEKAYPVQFRNARDEGRIYHFQQGKPYSSGGDTYKSANCYKDTIPADAVAFLEAIVASGPPTLKSKASSDTKYWLVDSDSAPASLRQVLEANFMVLPPSKLLRSEENTSEL